MALLCFTNLTIEITSWGSSAEEQGTAHDCICIPWPRTTNSIKLLRRRKTLSRSSLLPRTTTKQHPKSFQERIISQLYLMHFG
jgi:hypothetical protein